MQTTQMRLSCAITTNSNQSHASNQAPFIEQSSQRSEHAVCLLECAVRAGRRLTCALPVAAVVECYLTASATRPQLTYRKSIRPAKSMEMPPPPGTTNCTANIGPARARASATATETDTQT